jgi:hypothetical protein
MPHEARLIISFPPICSLKSWREMLPFRCTNFNLGAALLTLWFYLTRLLLVVIGTLGIWTEVYLHSFALIFWLLSCIAQQSSDYSDAKHPSRVPWYLTHACSIADSKNRAACRIAQVLFAMTLVFMWESCPCRRDIKFRTLILKKNRCFYAGWIIRVFVNALADYTVRKQTSKGIPLQGQSFRTHGEDGDACESSDEQSPVMRAWDELFWPMVSH